MCVTRGSESSIFNRSNEYRITPFRYCHSNSAACEVIFYRDSTCEPCLVTFHSHGNRCMTINGHLSLVSKERWESIRCVDYIRLVTSIKSIQSLHPRRMLLIPQNRYWSPQEIDIFITVLSWLEILLLFFTSIFSSVDCRQFLQI